MQLDTSHILTPERCWRHSHKFFMSFVLLIMAVIGRIFGASLKTKRCKDLIWNTKTISGKK